VNGIFGSSPFAGAMALALKSSEQTLRVSATPEPGPFFWRRANLATGEGVAKALKGLRKVWLLPADDEDISGFFAILKAGMIDRGVLVLPLDAEAPKGLKKHPTWAVLRRGPIWGAHTPLAHTWAQRLQGRQRIFLADPGPVAAVGTPLALEATQAIMQHRAARWTLTSPHTTTFPQLLDALAAQRDAPARRWKTPTGWMMRQTGVSPLTLARWLSAPTEEAKTPGWTPPSRLIGQVWFPSLVASDT